MIRSVQFVKSGTKLIDSGQIREEGQHNKLSSCKTRKTLVKSICGHLKKVSTDSRAMPAIHLNVITSSACPDE